MEVYDNERKTPVLYAIDECNFEVVQIMKDHIFLKKYEKKKANNSTILTESRFENSLQQRVQNNRTITPVSTPQRNVTINDDSKTAKNKNLLKVTNSHDESFGHGSDNNKFTPNRIHYNYDVTSPYYINITHRRHKPQPKFPAYPPVEKEKIFEESAKQQQENSGSNEEDILSISMQRVNLSSPEPAQETVNIFSLTQENLKELTERTASCERSRISLIETWREKVQKSRARQSILRQFDDIVEMIDEVVENDHLNFTNTELKEKSPLKETSATTKQPDIEVDSGACGSTSSSVIDTTEYHKLPNYNKNPVQPKVNNIQKSPPKPQMSLIKLMQTVAEAKVQDFETEHIERPKTPSPQQSADMESSYQTVPEIIVASPTDEQETKEPHNTTTNFIRSPKSNEYFLQMTEAYVHTDDENGLVFYETKLLSNVGNQQAQQRKH